MYKQYLCLRYFITTINKNKDYYRILNLTHTATSQQIKKSFHSLAKQYHPDTNKGNQDKFKQLNQAYQVLSTQQTKKDYDDMRIDEQFNINGYDPGFGNRKQYQQYTKYRQNPTRQNIFRGYQNNPGWANQNFNEKKFHYMHHKHHKQHQQQTNQQYYKAYEQKQANKQQKHSSQYKSGKLIDQLQKFLIKRSNDIKQKRLSMRYVYEEQLRSRQEDFQIYKDKQYNSMQRYVKDKAWKMAEGAKDNLDGMLKVGQNIKQNIEIVWKLGKLAKEELDQSKNHKKQ